VLSCYSDSDNRTSNIKPSEVVNTVEDLLCLHQSLQWSVSMKSQPSIRKSLQ